METRHNAELDFPLAKTIAGLAAAFLLTSPASADLQTKVVEQPTSCGENFAPLLSMNDPSSTSNNPGFPPDPSLDPGYSHRVCVSGVRAPYSVENGQCDGGKLPEFYMYKNSTDSRSHLSNQSIYDESICGGTLVTKFRQNTGLNGVCREDEKRMFTASDLSNAHVAGPNQDFFEYVACGSIEEPESVQMSYSFDIPGQEKTFLDGSPLISGQRSRPDYPAVVSSGTAHVTGIVAEDAVRAGKSSNTTVSVTRRAGRSDFLIPFTQGNQQEIQEEKQRITNSNFLSITDASFGYEDGGDPLVTVTLLGYDIGSNLTVSPGQHSLAVQKTGNNQISVSKN